MKDQETRDQGARGLELACPDCGRGSGWAAVRINFRALGGRVYVECPVCRVGAEPEKWEAARVTGDRWRARCRSGSERADRLAQILARRALGWTHARIAAELGVERSTVSFYLRGRCKTAEVAA
jgi:hypothetical protein